MSDRFISLHQTLNIFILCLAFLTQVVVLADTGTWCDVQLKKSALDGVIELSFETSYKQTILHVAVTSPVTKNHNSCMPSAVSSDSSILVRSSTYVHELADSIADCISKETDAYTMLHAVWRNMEVHMLRECISDRRPALHKQ